MPGLSSPQGVHYLRQRRREQAEHVLRDGPHEIPSPDEISNTPHTRLQLARWGIPWPPPAGWRLGLEARWRHTQPSRPVEQRPKARTAGPQQLTLPG